MKPVIAALLAFVVALPGWAAESNDEVRTVVILSRHGVRAPLASEIRGSVYNAQPWPAWHDDTGVLTEHGAAALRLMGAWYRTRYGCEPQTVYAEANTSQRTIASAKALVEGLGAGCEAEVAVRQRGEANPLFGPALASGAADSVKLANAIQGRLGGHPEWWTRAFSEPLEEMRRVLLNCSGVDCNRTNKKSLVAAPVVVGPAPGRGLVDVDGPVAMGADFAEHFLLQYTEGMPMEKVGWGRVSRASLDRLMEMNTRYHDFVLRTPYYAQIAGSDLACRIAATLRQAASGKETAGALGTPKDRVVILSGHDSNLTWLGGLLRMDWLLPDQTFNATTPGSALLFELHRSRATGELRIQAFFASQTLDQIRFLKPLSGSEQPALAPVFIPGCSGGGADYSCSVEGFSQAVESAIDARFLEPAISR